MVCVDASCCTERTSMIHCQNVDEDAESDRNENERL